MRLRSEFSTRAAGPAAVGGAIAVVDTMVEKGRWRRKGMPSGAIAVLLGCALVIAAAWTITLERISYELKASDWPSDCGSPIFLSRSWS